MRFRVNVGNEPLAWWEGGVGTNGPLLVPGLQNMQAALQQEGLLSVTCTVAFFNGIMGTTYPPEAGEFDSQYVSTISGVADFLYQTGSEFNVHIYPWFARVGDPTNVPLDLALGNTQNTINGIYYNGLIHQQIAAARAALNRMNANYASVPISVGESGWPSGGNHAEATVANAEQYTTNVIAATSRQDVPLDPNLGTVYLFEAFDEQGKAAAGHGGGGSTVENNFGIFYESGAAKYSVSFPTPSPTPSPPVSPSPSPTPGGASAVGDPHLQNIHGERFDLMKVGRHVLINIPRGKDAEHAMLRVQADARRFGGKCADLYFQELNITGSWAEAKKAGGFHYSVSQHDDETPEWVAFGKVQLKVVHGRTDRGLLYLNVYVKHLRRAGFAIGGVLGEDDHEDIIVPPDACAKKMSLLELGEGHRL